MRNLRKFWHFFLSAAHFDSWYLYLPKISCPLRLQCSKVWMLRPGPAEHANPAVPPARLVHQGKYKPRVKLEIGVFHINTSSHFDNHYQQNFDTSSRPRRVSAGLQFQFITPDICHGWGYNDNPSRCNLVPMCPLWSAQIIGSNTISSIN